MFYVYYNGEWVGTDTTPFGVEKILRKIRISEDLIKDAVRCCWSDYDTECSSVAIDYGGVYIFWSGL